MIFDFCPAHDSKCPCLTCEDEHCKACIGTGPGRYGVDTEKLCARAKAYCENEKSKQKEEKESREVTLLKAVWQLLDKQKNSPCVLNLLTETVFYNEAECDGYCLSDDILDCLLEKGIDLETEG